LCCELQILDNKINYMILITYAVLRHAEANNRTLSTEMNVSLRLQAKPR